MATCASCLRATLHQQQLSVTMYMRTAAYSREEREIFNVKRCELQMKIRLDNSPLCPLKTQLEANKILI